MVVVGLNGSKMTDYIRALAKTSKKQPNLFAHWGYGYRPSLKYVN